MNFNSENISNCYKTEKRDFSNDADKKYKLSFIFTDSGLVLSPRAKIELINLIEILDLNMFATPDELALYIKQELDSPFETINIPNTTLIPIARIMLAKNF